MRNIERCGPRLVARRARVVSFINVAGNLLMSPVGIDYNSPHDGISIKHKPLHHPFVEYVGTYMFMLARATALTHANSVGAIADSM